MERRALPAIAITANSATLTAIGNDYGFNEVFRRAVEAHGKKGDVLIAISTSGNSANIVASAEQAKNQGLKVISLSGGIGGKLKELSDIAIIVPSSDTPRVQESHILVGHIICDLIEKEMFSISASKNKKRAKNKAVFLDRDGTINIDNGYVYKREDFKFIKGVPQSIKKLNDAGYKVIVISNQSGIARGFYTAKDVKKLHNHIDAELKKNGAKIDAYYFCPHHPNFNGKCECRKPKIGLIEQAVQDFNIDLSQSYFVGDKKSDEECAKNAGLKAILVGEKSISKNLYGFVSQTFGDDK
ncbi:hypothetical protein AGMMS49938_18910 [Fibrobacterales bacterium]|nr:hypothetical protein AGMMS49938_18910 [Fibrobacterales bacterium]